MQSLLARSFHWEPSVAMLCTPFVHDPWCNPNDHTSGIWLEVFVKHFNLNNVNGINKQGWQDHVKRMPWYETTLNDVIVKELIDTTALIGGNNLCD